MSIKPLETDTIKLMNQLARMAAIPEGYHHRMVLVLDVDDIPRLFTETFLVKTDEELEAVPLTAEERPIVVDTTTMQNKHMVTKIPLPKKQE